MSDDDSDIDDEEKGRKAELAAKKSSAKREAVLGKRVRDGDAHEKERPIESKKPRV